MKLKRIVSIVSCCGVLLSGVNAMAAPANVGLNGTYVGDSIVQVQGSPILNKNYTSLVKRTPTVIPAGQTTRFDGVFGYDGFNKDDGNRFIFKATLMEKKDDGTVEAVKDVTSETWDLDIGTQLEVIKNYTRDQFTFNFTPTLEDEGKEYFVRYEIYDTDNNFVSNTYHDPVFQAGNTIVNINSITNDLLVDRFDDLDMIVKVGSPLENNKRPTSETDTFLIDEANTTIGGAGISVLPRLIAGYGYLWNGLDGRFAYVGDPETNYRLTVSLVNGKGEIAKNYDGKELTDKIVVTTNDKGEGTWRWGLQVSLPEEYTDSNLHLRYTMQRVDGNTDRAVYDRTDQSMYVTPFSARGKYNAQIVTEGTGMLDPVAELTASETVSIENDVYYTGLAGGTQYTLSADLIDVASNTAIPGYHWESTFRTRPGASQDGRETITTSITPDEALAGKRVYLRYEIIGGSESNLPKYDSYSTIGISADSTLANPPVGIHINSGVAPIDGRVMSVVMPQASVDLDDVTVPDDTQDEDSVIDGDIDILPGTDEGLEIPDILSGEDVVLPDIGVVPGEDITLPDEVDNNEADEIVAQNPIQVVCLKEIKPGAEAVFAILSPTETLTARVNGEGMSNAQVHPMSGSFSTNDKIDALQMNDSEFVCALYTFTVDEDVSNEVVLNLSHISALVDGEISQYPDVSFAFKVK